MSIQSELSAYHDIFSNELHENILSYWMKYGVEKGGKGFYGAVNLSNEPVLWANKTSVLNARILWTFAAAARKYPGKGYEPIAHKAFRVVTEDFADKEHGGFYMELDADNAVANDLKHTYAQAFVLYSLSKYYEFKPVSTGIGSDQGFLLLSRQENQGSPACRLLRIFYANWKIDEENRMADNNEPKSMNTHLHLLEACAAVYKIWKDELVKQRLTELLELFLDHIIREDGHLGIFFSEEFSETDHSKAICSFGHDIEASWLIWEAAEILGDPSIMAKIKPLCMKMADAVLREGVDKDGGLFLESTRFGSHVRTNKHWWLQAENLVGFMNAFQLTGDPLYWDTVKLAWNFIDKHVIDHEGGEWFTKVNRLGKPYLIEPEDDPSPYYRNDWKIDPWKCPYHNGRAMIELTNRISALLEK